MRGAHRLLTAHDTGMADNGGVPLYRDEAIVLRAQKLGEADRIVTLLTREHGKVRAVGKGVRRTSSRFGARLVPAKSVLAQLAQFRAAGAIGIIADQVPRSSPDRHWTEFLSQPTAFYMGPEILGRALKAQVLFVDLRRVARGRYELAFTPLSQPDERLPVGSVTERYARTLERAINADPPAWWWSHRRWKLPPPEVAAPSVAR